VPTDGGGGGDVLSALGGAGGGGAPGGDMGGLGGGAPAPAVAQAVQAGGGMSQEQALQELAMALQELGISPEELAQMAQQGGGGAEWALVVECRRAQVDLQAVGCLHLRAVDYHQCRRRRSR
jgi:hypothetical protein